MELREVFGTRLKILRKSKKYTQPRLAEILNVPTKRIKNWEGAVNIPPAEMLCKIADCFDVSLDYLMGREEGHR